MEQIDQQNAFSGDLKRLMDRYRSEFSMSLGSMVGCLEVMKHCLIQEILEEDEDDT